MPIYLWSAGVDSEKSKAVEFRLRAAISDLVTISDVDVLIRPAKNKTEPTYLAVIAPRDDRRVFTQLTDLAARHRDRLFLILISDDITVDDYKTVRRTGGADWVSTYADPQEILDVVSHRQAYLAEAKPERLPERRSAAISFVPSAGGVGNTTLAVEIGTHLKTGKTTRDRKICLVDLDFQSGNICDYLDIEPRLQIQEISTDPERLDAQLFDIFVSRHQSGLDVFAAPRTKFDYCNLNLSALDGLLSIAATRYDLILFDLPLAWFHWTPTIIAASNAALVIGVNTVPGLRQTVETLAAIRAIPDVPGQLVVAINRCQRRMIGGIARRQHVETALRGEQIFYIGEEPMALESINTGSPLASNKSYRAIGKDIAALTDFCSGLIPARAEKS